VWVGEVRREKAGLHRAGLSAGLAKGRTGGWVVGSVSMGVESRSGMGGRWLEKSARRGLVCQAGPAWLVEACRQAGDGARRDDWSAGEPRCGQGRLVNADAVWGGTACRQGMGEAWHVVLAGSGAVRLVGKAREAEVCVVSMGKARAGFGVGSRRGEGWVG
jgi:hypothetical protein